MNAYRHIFLTGEKQLGKSTLWKKVLAQADIQVAGFVTLPYEINGHFAGYCLHSLSALPEGQRNDVPISVCLEKNIHLGIPESFDVFGVAVLEAALRSAPFILMDELGKFERNAAIFQQAVNACLASPHHHVLGVLQKTDSPFLAAIQQREDVLSIAVTTDNRDTLATQLYDALSRLR